MKNRLFTISIGCLIAFVLQSCQECDDKVYHDVNPITLPYFSVYKPGNWWVFENSKRTKKDSLFVTELNSRFSPREKFDCDVYRKINAGGIHSYFLFNAQDSTLSSISFNYSNSLGFNAAEGETEFEINHSDNAMSTVYSAANFYYNSSKNTFESTISTQSAQLIDSVQLDGNKYYSVYKFIGDYSVYYFAKEVGLVRVEKPTDTFTLSKYKIL